MRRQIWIEMNKNWMGSERVDGGGIVGVVDGRRIFEVMGG